MEQTKHIVNSREFVRKVLKISFLVLINFLLLNTIEIDPNKQIIILTTNVIFFCITDIFFPSININDNINDNNE